MLNIWENFIVQINLIFQKLKNEGGNIPNKLTEILNYVIRRLKNGSSPGINGCGPQFYKHFEDLLLSYMRTLFNQIIKGEESPQLWENAR